MNRSLARVNEHFHALCQEITTNQVESSHELLSCDTWRPEHSYTTSLNTVHSTQDPHEEVEVAMESNTLCTILPLVDSKEQVEVILDPGCQVVMMSKEVCNVLALPYNVDVCLNMVTMNGRVNQSLRVAQNIAFFVGDITIYLQVHILRSPTYDILLG